MPVRGWVQACEWQRRGSELTADAAEDATVISIEDLSDFDDAGGIISLNDQTIGYDSDAIDEDAGTIQLDTGLAAAATVGDPVYTYSGGQILRDVVLLVACGDGDLVEVRVPFAQRDYWPEGDYEDPVLVELSDDLEKVLEAPGRIPTSTELTEARGGYDGSLQDIFDAADAAATAAADAAANATTALTAANGKNKVTVSLSSPGSTPNSAGDIWFRKESSTQTIIEQWEGQGGTSWNQVALNDQVIANLDAGKIVAGSAFTNALSVKTNFTLGDASTNGVIQSYNFAGSSVGIYIDKFGIVAKGGSLSGSTITGGTIEGAGFYSPSSSASTRVQITAGAAGNVTFYFGGSQVGYVGATSGGLALVGPGSVGAIIDSTGFAMFGGGDVSAADVSAAGKLYVGTRSSTTAAPNLRVGAGGEVFEANTSLGPTDSGGTGFRLVRVPN